LKARPILAQQLKGNETLLMFMNNWEAMDEIIMPGK
jgi:hypothetical protein